MAEQRPSGGGDAGDQVWIRYGESGRTIFEVVPVSLKQQSDHQVQRSLQLAPPRAPAPPVLGALGRSRWWERSGAQHRGSQAT